MSTPKAEEGTNAGSTPIIPEAVKQGVDEGHDADKPSSQGNTTVAADDKASGTSPGRPSDGTNPSVKSVEKDVEKTDIVDSGDNENTIWWDGDNDPQNPYNWASWIKVLNCFLVSALCFVTPLASSMFAPGVPELLVEFKSNSSELATFCISVYVLGLAAGPMVFAPLSEIYGRVPVYHVTNVGFVVFLIACAKAPNMSSFIAFRFLSGVFGSCPLTNGGGTIADLIRQEKRGAAMAGFAMGPLLGPIIGPVAGGFVTDSLGWRWTFWILAIVAGTLSTMFFIFSRETYAPIILQRKVNKMKKDTGNELLRSKLDAGLTPRDFFVRGIVRPIKMILFSPICIFAGVYIALVYGYLYLMFSTITPIFMEIYGFSVIQAGLAFLGLGVGSFIGVAVFSITSDRYIKKKAKEEDALAAAEGREAEGMKPEYRLPPLKIGAIVLPAGLFIYGWTAEKEAHWITPIIGTMIVGVGNLLVFMALQLYLIDAFTLYSASALAANTVMRSIFGSVLPLAAIPMFDKLGVGWGNSLLGFVAIIFLPAPWLALRYGEFLRKKYEIKDL